VQKAGTVDLAGIALDLMAIALQTGRAKDHARLVMFVEAGITDMDRLRDILTRHSLLAEWAKFENRFLQP